MFKIHSFVGCFDSSFSFIAGQLPEIDQALNIALLSFNLE
jgi:hypothetical protein|tara:strand:+ start:176 stop:295 length:120 start_codon:yes stop_codon:yes gene_type:complete